MHIRRVSVALESRTFDLIRQSFGDRYEVQRELGRGGMGTVFLARDVRLDRSVALKVLLPEFGTDTRLRERFLRETRTAASFSHPNIVPVYAVEESGDLVAYAMGLVEGETLLEHVTRVGVLPARSLVRLLQDVGYALAYAHGRGVVHRDIKPENVMLERATGRALVMDFGISRSMRPVVAVSNLTRVGEIVGTPEYMSPEQAAGDVVDGRSDLYALGLTVIYAATGRTAVTGESTQKILVRQLTEPLASIATARPDLHPALVEAIDRCVEKDPSDRFETAEALVEALDAAQLAEPEIPLPIRLFGGELATLSLIVVGIMLWAALLVQSAWRARMEQLDITLGLVGLFAVVLTRAITTLGEARQLVVAGFEPADVSRGLALVMEERSRRREELRADAGARRRRRRTLVWSTASFVVAIAMIVAALRMRIPRVGGGFSSPPAGVALVACGVAILATSGVLLLKSPFRAHLGELLFRLIWLGPTGRAFVRLAGWGVRAGPNTAARPSTSRAPRSKPSGTPKAHAAALRSPAQPGSAAAGLDRIADLEARVAALERQHGDR